MPEDFLRVVLSEKQVNESRDRALAHQLQYSMSMQTYMPYPIAPIRVRDPEIDYSRGRLQINIVEAKLTKNYGLTKMDPFVRMKLGNKIFETQTCYHGSKNPVWKKTVLWYLILISCYSFLIVEFYLLN